MMKSDHSLMDKNGEILQFNVTDFINKIVKSSNCFVCGASSDEKTFNDEHIIPNWILKKIKLHNRSVKLPNSSIHKYFNYTIPCCESCNTRLGEIYEKPMSKLFESDYNHFMKLIMSAPLDYRWLIYSWMCLVFIKVHLKDLKLRWDLDRRNLSKSIGEDYDWVDLHHIHCVMRIPFSKPILDKHMIGSIFFAPVINDQPSENFDYLDNVQGKTIHVRINDIAIIAALDDSTAVLDFFGDRLRKINGKLSLCQVREIFSRFSHINMNLHPNGRPYYHSRLNENFELEMFCELPNQFKLLDKDQRRSSFGKIFRYYIDGIIDENDENRDAYLEGIENGTIRCLFDQNGNFNNTDNNNEDTFKSIYIK